jgi:hypothetical protein
VNDDNKCPNAGTWSGRHDFQPRYDRVPPADIPQIKGSGSVALEALELLCKRTYVRDICTRCGKAIERKP